MIEEVHYFGKLRVEKGVTHAAFVLEEWDRQLLDDVVSDGEYDAVIVLRRKQDKKPASGLYHAEFLDDQTVRLRYIGDSSGRA